MNKVRQIIRQVLTEDIFGYYYDDDPNISSTELQRGDLAYTQAYSDDAVLDKQNLTVSDIEGESLETLAAKFGFANATGVNMWIRRILLKAKYLITLEEDNPQQFNRMMLIAVAKYIAYLRSSGELDEEEIEFLNKHPYHVAELEGFREFVHPIIKQGMKEA